MSFPLASLLQRNVIAHAILAVKIFNDRSAILCPGQILRPNPKHE